MATRVTLYKPFEEYVWEGFCKVLPFESPKSQSHEVGELVDKSIKFIKPLHVEVVLASKSATGGMLAGIISIE